MESLVSIIMSVYNGERFLRPAIESIICQRFSDFEFIIIDDGSYDNSWTILNEYADQDGRLKLIRNKENIGLTRSLNKGLSLARGKYIARQDADDISSPERLQKQIDFLENHPEIVMVSSNFDYIDAIGRIIAQKRICNNHDEIAWNLLFYNHIGGHSQVVFRRDPAMILNGYCEDFYYAQDYDLWLRLLNLGQVAVLPDVLLQQRQHQHNVSRRACRDQFQQVLKTSGHQLSRLIGDRLTIDQVKQLWSFWTVQYPPGHTSLNTVDEVSLGSRMEQIFNGFMVHYSPRSMSPDQLDYRLRHLIGERCLRWFFIYWIKERDLRNALRMLGFAKRWLNEALGIVLLRVCAEKLQRFMAKQKMHLLNCKINLLQSRQ